jgi:hypothetical protein
MVIYQHIPIWDAGRQWTEGGAPSTRGAVATNPGLEPARRTPATGTTSPEAVLDTTSGEVTPAKSRERLKQPA